MTVEQLKQANKIMEEIKKLKEFKRVFSYKSAPNIIIAQYYINSVVGDDVAKESRLDLRDFPDLQDFISGYFSDKITGLEKQLEEL